MFLCVSEKLSEKLQFLFFLSCVKTGKKKLFLGFTQENKILLKFYFSLSVKSSGTRNLFFQQF